uniref:Uncharacterized protein n=1 Tax=Oryza brachyantha TaxID=4533 RepID=J3MKM4_ORYBR
MDQIVGGSENLRWDQRFLVWYVMVLRLASDCLYSLAIYIFASAEHFLINSKPIFFPHDPSIVHQTTSKKQSKQGIKQIPLPRHNF